MKPVLILGGTGFVGRALCAKLAQQQTPALVLTRRPETARALGVFPRVTVVGADVFSAQTLDQCVGQCSAVVNLVGVLHDKPRGVLRRAHVTLTEGLVAACRRQGVSRIVHVSALGAAIDAPSLYQRTKAEGEAALLASGHNVTLLAPSVIFGPGDSFLSLFARISAFLPPGVPMLLPGANVKFQPVFVGDVANAIAWALADPATHGQRYELAGPKVYRLRDIVRTAAQTVGRSPFIVGCPRPLAALQAAVLERLPGPLMSRDNLRSMQVDNVSSAAWPNGLPARQSLEAIVPTYLGDLTDARSAIRNRRR